MIPDSLLPDPSRSELVIGPPGEGPGYWAGGPSAVLSDGVFFLAYRLRRPVSDGRGYANVVARSEDGVRFETVATLHRDGFEAASLERPALVRRPDGGWRIYVSCSTLDSKHWWVDAVDAPTPDSFDPAQRVTVFPGDEHTAMKDVVVRVDGLTAEWHAWVCCHPLDDPDATDRMVTCAATSSDGLVWKLGEPVLAGTPGSWDARGARFASPLPGPGGHVLYDGRASAAENWEERTGLAVMDGDRLRSVAGPRGSLDGTGCLRYADAVGLPGGGHRLYYEVARADGAHEIRTELVDGPPPSRG